MTYLIVTVTGQWHSVLWDIIISALVMLTLCGDITILLLFDKRWKMAFTELIKKLKFRKSKFRG